MVRIIAVLLVFSLTASAFSAELRRFQAGQIIRAEHINENFDGLRSSIEQVQAGMLKCQTFRRDGPGTVNCPAGQVMAGGGFELTGETARVTGSAPFGNGWACSAEGLGSDEELGCFARCCGAVSLPSLSLGPYCSTSYCWDNSRSFPSFTSHTHYAMTFPVGVFQTFPMEVDENFVFPPENIGAASLLVRFQGETFHVTNVDENCLKEDESRNWSDCFISPWLNQDAFEADCAPEALR